MKETQLQNEIRKAITETDRVRLWRNNIGVTPVPCAACSTIICGKCASKYRHPVRYGLAVGSADLVGITDQGVFVSLEIKTPKGKMSEEQLIWQKLIRKWGGIAETAHSVEEALSVLGLQ